ncbi:MAG: SET domain-containing protein-lysine N-methyltransferase [Opitutaceae bacterium]
MKVATRVSPKKLSAPNSSSLQAGPRSLIPRWIRAAESAIDGQGVYARQPIPDGTRVIEYTGERITKAEANRREAARLARQHSGGDDCVYIFNLNRRHDLDGRTQANVARLINHSCAPNCRAETIRGRIWIVAKRDIPRGEELTFDYGFSFKEWRLHPCRCRAKRCPGFIVGSFQRWRLRRISRAERARAAAR